MITKSFGKQVLPQHAIINISCEAIGDRKPTVSWYHDGKLIDKALDSRVELKHDQDLWMLQIKRLTAADSGVYRCEAKSLGGMNFSEAEILIEGETNPVSVQFIHQTPHLPKLEKNRNDKTFIFTFRALPFGTF